MVVNILQLAVDIGGILGLITTASFLAFVLFGQRLQYRMAMGGIKRSVERLEMMNARAKELGCMNTHFDNPNGLNDDNHTTTAHDLALIARARGRCRAGWWRPGPAACTAAR